MDQLGGKLSGICTCLQKHLHIIMLCMFEDKAVPFLSVAHLQCAAMQASDAYLQTNNQYLSLTDQMNLGVRIVELDTHFFDVS